MKHTTKRQPNGHWNYETCYQEARNYNSRSEFCKGSKGAYKVALKKGWLDNYTWFSVSKTIKKWNYKTCYQEAKKYNSRNEFRKSCVSAYQVACKKGWLDNYTWFSEKKKQKPSGYWEIYENNYKEAKNYNSRSEFAKGCIGAYQVACKNNWLDNYTWFTEKQKSKGHWNYETCYQEARNYNSRSEFYKGSKGAYEVARKKGWLDNYIWFIEKKKSSGYWETYENNYKEAKKYNSRSEFKKNCDGAYKVALKNGWLDIFFPKGK